MSNLWFLVAGLATFSVTALHVFGGGKSAARPLLDAQMDRVAKYTNYYCWHLVTLTLLFIGGMFTWAAYHPEGIELAFVATMFCAAFMVLSLIIVGLNKWRFFDYPQWVLFLVIMVIGLIGFR